MIVLGVVSMSKRPDLLVYALALAGRSHPCRLAFVGPCPPLLHETIDDRARYRGIAERVEVVGPVDTATWAEWCGRASIAVQLRHTQSGENTSSSRARSWSAAAGRCRAPRV